MRLKADDPITAAAWAITSWAIRWMLLALAFSIRVELVRLCLGVGLVGYEHQAGKI
jgi:hypothetical protein